MDTVDTDGRVGDFHNGQDGQGAKIHKEFLYKKNKTSTLMEKMNRHFPKEGLQKAKKHMERCLIISKSKHAN